jgi:hypothetical protein
MEKLVGEKLGWFDWEQQAGPQRVRDKRPWLRERGDHRASGPTLQQGARLRGEHVTWRPPGGGGVTGEERSGGGYPGKGHFRQRGR